MTRHLGLIVTDASPLITLAAGEALDCLTMPRLPVMIPDMVYAEVTRDLARLGAEDVVFWVRRHQDQVRLAPSAVFAEFQALIAINPRTRSRGRGEQAALEVLGAAIAADPELHAALLFEDNDIRNRGFVRAMPDRVTAFSTGDLLHVLEAAGRIQSADQILDRAMARGRNVDRQRQPVGDAEGRSRLHHQLTGRQQ